MNKIKNILISSLILLFPFFFLSTTQEYFTTNKLYLLSFGVLLFLLSLIVEIIFIKKIQWAIKPLDNVIILFLTSVTISIVLASTNKFQALLNPNFGLVMMISLVILYFFISRFKKNTTNFGDFQIISTVLSLITIIFYFQPFKNPQLANLLPQNFAFLKNPLFTPVGNQLDLAIILGFCLVFGFTQIIKRINDEKRQLIFYSLFLTINLLALSLTIFSLVKVQMPNLSASSLMLPPFRLSFFAAFETLTKFQTAIVGVGPDNFSVVFTAVKDLAYNQSSLWQINSFNVSHSAVLQILTETGLFGLFSFGLLIFSSFKQLLRIQGDKRLQNICLFSYLIICLLLFPSSIIIWFLFFVTLGLINKQLYESEVLSYDLTKSTDLSSALLIYLTTIVSFCLIIGAGYFLSRSYLSEYYFKKSIDGMNVNNIKQVYDSQKKAIILNPYVERFRGNFSQTNLLIANNLAQKKSSNVTDQDKQIITQAIQTAISEAKAVVSLNPKRADNWQNLASIYSNIINIAKGADVWAISASQRAILADPQNPMYRVGLGGVYYSQKKYDDALKFFEQAVSLKPDWPTANYNYAWANFQNKDFPKAVNAMEYTLSLLDPKLNKSDYQKAQKELEEFKKMLLEKNDVLDNYPDEKTKLNNLNLPTPTVVEVNPKIELPKEASPEAK
jgi:tetratricopeptide (TPR) repeat protein